MLEISIVIILNLSWMNDNEPTVNSQRNSDFIKNIKDKYTSAKATKASNVFGSSIPSGYQAEKGQYQQRMNGSVLQSKQATLNSRAGYTGENYSKFDRNYVNAGEYQTFRGQDRDGRQGYFKENNYNEQYQEREGQQAGMDSTNKSSPIKKFYQSSKNNENYLAKRRNEIDEMHRQRAIQHRIEREINERTIADIDQLLQSIRATLAQQQYRK